MFAPIHHATGAGPGGLTMAHAGLPIEQRAQ